MGCLFSYIIFIPSMIIADSKELAVFLDFIFSENGMNIKLAKN